MVEHFRVCRHVGFFRLWQLDEFLPADEVFAALGVETRRTIYHEKGGAAMLVLSRQIRESVVIEGADGFRRLLKVTVLEIDGPTVKLGIEVDPGVTVHRAEVRERSRKGPREGVADYALT